jgi:hypothetical protein
MTSSEARIIGSVRDPYKTENQGHLGYHKLNRKRGRMGGQLKISRFGKYVTSWFDYLFVSQEEMKRILEGTRWRIQEFIDSENLQYVAIIQKDSLRHV